MEFRKAILYGKGDLRIESESFTRSLLDDDVLVETEVTALSTGTDLGNYLGDSVYVPGAPAYPRAVGYSNVGVVRETGPAVRNLHVGDRVFTTRPHRSGFVASASDLLVRVPEAVPSEEACLAYMAQLGLAALRQARYETGENVVVVGLGVIGLTTIATSSAMGARVLGVANSGIRARAAIAMGAADCIDSQDPDPVASMKGHFQGGEADIVILTSNSWESYFLALELARTGGRVSILGFPGRAQAPSLRNPLDPALVYAKQLTLLGAGLSPRLECEPQDLRFNLRRNLEYILDLLAAKRLSFAPSITHRYPYTRMREAYELAREHSKDLIAAIFEWTEAGLP
jgi:threonine dehydrogenase-like Zn-dependent dehydrogenase